MMSKWISADSVINKLNSHVGFTTRPDVVRAIQIVQDEPGIDIVRCKECRKSHIDGKTTHYLWCSEWGRSTDTFGYCERGEREGE